MLKLNVGLADMEKDYVMGKYPSYYSYIADTW